MTPDSPGGSESTEWTDCVPPVSAMGTVVRTACGGTVQHTAATPCVIHQGQTVYFCLPICKAGLETDPRHSCLTLNPGR